MQRKTQRDRVDEEMEERERKRECWIDKKIEKEKVRMER